MELVTGGHWTSDPGTRIERTQGGRNQKRTQVEESAGVFGKILSQKRNLRGSTFVSAELSQKGEMSNIIT